MSTRISSAEKSAIPAPGHSAARQLGSQAKAEFADNRPATTAHRQQQALISNSPRMQRAAASQALIAKSPRQQAAQLQAVTKPEPAAQVAAPPANNTGLPDALKSGIENLSGYSLDDVQVHYNSDKPAQLQAHAYAQGTDIHVAPGQEKHLPHEAWHVVQQKQGRVRPTRQLKGEVAVNDDAGLEKEADVMGMYAIQFHPAPIESNFQHGQSAGLKSDSRPSNFQSETNNLLQAKWINDEGWKWDSAEWHLRLLYKSSPSEPVDMPKVLEWDGRNYQASAASFEAKVTSVESEEAQGFLPYLIKWREWSLLFNLKDSIQIVTQIIDVIQSKEEGVQLLSVWNGNWLRGVSLYEIDGTTECAPEIPEQDSHYIYVMFSAAHPATQLPRSIRGVGNEGGVGGAMNAEYDNVMVGMDMKFPIFRHAANPTSYLSLLRAGYEDIHAEKDGFLVPKTT